MEGKTKTQFRAHGRGTREGKGSDGVFSEYQPDLEEERARINTQSTNNPSFLLWSCEDKSLKTTNETI
jgi:hypothetical protein